MTAQAKVSLVAGAPFLSDTQLQLELDKAGVSPDVTSELMAENKAAQTDALDTALGLLALLALLSLFFTGRIPNRSPSDTLA